MTREEMERKVLALMEQLTPEQIAEVIERHKKMTAPGWTPDAVGADNTSKQTQE